MVARTQLAQAVHTEFEQWAADFVAESAALNRDMLAQQRAVWGAAEPPPQVKKKKEPLVPLFRNTVPVLLLEYH